MVDYQKMYSILFNAITDAVNEMEENKFCKALEILILAQQTTEAMYITAEDE